MRFNLRVAGVLLIGVLLTACSSSSSSSSASSGGPGSSAASSSASSAPLSPSPAGSSTASISGTGNGIKTASSGIGTVLTDTDGLTIYWFAADSAGKSNCDASCVAYWPVVKGPVSAASGVSLPGKFGTITRADGTTQATYDGHPLYTYTGDPGPGLTTGNGQNASGGLWWAMTPSGNKPS